MSTLTSEINDSSALAQAQEVADLEPACSGKRGNRFTEGGAGLQAGSCPGLVYWHPVKSCAGAQPGSGVGTSWSLTGWCR